MECENHPVFQKDFAHEVTRAIQQNISVTIMFDGDDGSSYGFGVGPTKYVSQEAKTQPQICADTILAGTCARYAISFTEDSGELLITPRNIFDTTNGSDQVR